LLPYVDKVREDCLEILQVGSGGHLCIALQPLLGWREAAPAGKLGRDIDFAPFGMVARIKQPLKAGEERVDEIYQIAVSVGPHRERGSREHGAYRHGVHCLVRLYKARIIRGGEPRRHISGCHRRGERDGEKMETLLAVKITKQRCRLSCDKGNRSNLAPAQLFEPNLLIVVGRCDGNLQKVEEPSRCDSGTAAAQIDVYLLVGEVCDTLDILPREQMELLVIELGDVGDPVLDAVKSARCWINGLGRW